jgi:hypothetical protein
MEEVVLRSRLEECLLTDDELRLTPAHWSLWDCPLPIPSMEEIMAEPSDAE